MAYAKRKPRVGALDTIGGVVTEMGQVYRETRRGDMDSMEGSRLVSMLTQIRTAIEGSEFEARLRALEDKNAGV